MPSNKPGNTGKPVRLSDGLLAGPDDLVVICIPEFFRDVLLSLVDRVFWSKVWGRSLTEEEISRLEYSVWRLSQEECDMEITVNPTITINNNDTVQGGGGGGGSDCGCSTPPPWRDYPWPGGTQCYPTPTVPEPDPDTTPPVPPPDTEPSEWDLYRCKLANYAYDQILVWLTKVSQIPNTLLTIGAVLALLWATLPAALLALAGGAILELASLVWTWYATSEGLDEVAEYAITWWTERREEIVCKFYNMTDVSETYASILEPFLEDLVLFAESRPWWFTEAVELLDRFSQLALPFNLFLAPWRLVPPTGYVGTVDCLACGGASTGGDWIAITSQGTGTPVFTTNTGPAYDVDVVITAGGAGGSYAEMRVYLDGMVDIPDEDFTFTAVSFTLDRVALTQAASGSSGEYQLLYGAINNTTRLMELWTRDVGSPLAVEEGEVTIALRLSTHPAIGADFEYVVESKSFLRPQFYLGGVGYLQPPLTENLAISDFQLIP